MIGSARRPRDIAGVAFAGAVAWVGVVWLLRGGAMGMGSAMGMSLLGFIGAWTLMMAAMMLPAVSPVAALYVRSFGAADPGRLAQFALGYLVVWAAIGLPAFGIALGSDWLSMALPGTARWAVVGALVGVAAYQLTPLKRLCLEHCRSPLSQLLHYASFRGLGRDFRAGVHHAVYCAGCCWPLMVLLVAFGTMNLAVMLALTAVIAAEKLLPAGERISRLAAVAAMVVAIAIAVSPGLFSRVAGI